MEETNAIIENDNIAQESKKLSTPKKSPNKRKSSISSTKSTTKDSSKRSPKNKSPSNKGRKSSSSGSKNLVQLTMAQATSNKDNGGRNSVGGASSNGRRSSILNDRKRKIELLEHEEEERKSLLGSLKSQRSRLQKAMEVALTLPPVKFPVQDELLPSLLAPEVKGTKLLQELPEAKSLLDVSSDHIPDLLMVWDFQFMFHKELNLSPLSLEDLVQLLQWHAAPSLALTELFLGLLRLVVHSSVTGKRLVDSVGRANTTQSNSRTGRMSLRPDLIRSQTPSKLLDVAASEVEGITDGEEETKLDWTVFGSYNGAQLFSASGSSLLINDLTWPCFLRTLLPMLEPVRRLLLDREERRRAAVGRFKRLRTRRMSDVSGGDHGGTVKSGPDIDVIFGVCSSNSANGEGGGDRLQLLGEALADIGLKEPHQLSFAHKLTLLSTLCQAAYDTTKVQELLVRNAEERLARMTAQEKLDREEKRKLKDVPKELRERAIEKCRQVNIEKERIELEKAGKNQGKDKDKGKGKSGAKKPKVDKQAKGDTDKVGQTASAKPGKAGETNSSGKEKDPYYPSHFQLNAAIEEELLLQQYGIQVVLPTAPQEDSESDEDGGDASEDENEGKRRPSRDPNAEQKRRQRQEREGRRRDRAQADVLLRAALAETSGRRLKLLRDAIRLGSRVGLVGKLEGDTKKTFCTDLMRQAYKALADLEQALKETEAERAMSKALAELFIRVEPLGSDRYGRRYWSFDGDERLWVESFAWAGEGRAPGLAPGIANQDSGRPEGLLSISPVHKTLASQLSMDPSQERLLTRRPSSWTSRWSVYQTARELWALSEALDDRGEREKALKKAINQRFQLEEPSELKPYLDSGHEYLGLHVLRRFQKRHAIGRITGWLPAEESSPAMWRVEYLDGDEEDLSLREVEKALIEKQPLSSSCVTQEPPPSSTEQPMEIDGAISNQQPPVADIEPPTVAGETPMTVLGDETDATEVKETDGDGYDSAAAANESNRPKESSLAITPTVVTYYTNDLGGNAFEPSTKIGLSGIRTELLQLMNSVVGGLKARGSDWNRNPQGRKAWEKAARSVESASELGSLLLELEETLYSVQTEEDIQDDDEVAKADSQQRAEMESEGWVFQGTAGHASIKMEEAGGGCNSGEEVGASVAAEVSIDAEPTVAPLVKDSAGTDFIERRVRRFFPDFGKSDGVVVAYLPRERNDGVPLWHMIHDDGDEEDLDEQELTDSMRYYDQDITEAPDGDGDLEESGEADGDASDEAENASEESDLEDQQAEEGGVSTSTKTLWPTAGVRERWRSAVSGSHTIGEIALALMNLREHAFAFGVADSAMPLAAQGDKRKRLWLHTAVMWNKRGIDETAAVVAAKRVPADTAVKAAPGSTKKSGKSHRAVSEKSRISLTPLRRSSSRNQGKSRPKYKDSDSEEGSSDGPERETGNDGRLGLRPRRKNVCYAE